MGRNKKENFVFTLMMCVLMVAGMSVYNVVLTQGFSLEALAEAALGFVPAFAVALVLDVFVVGKAAKGLANKLLKETASPVQKVLLISCLMVTGMVIFMSLYGAVLHAGFTSGLPLAYAKAAGLNVICALPLQLLIVGPLTRLLFIRLFPSPDHTSQPANSPV